MNTHKFARNGVSVFRNSTRKGRRFSVRYRIFFADMDGMHVAIDPQGVARLKQATDSVCYLGTFPRPIDIDSILPELEKRARTYVNQIQWPKFAKIAA